MTKEIATLQKEGREIEARKLVIKDRMRILLRKLEEMDGES